MLPPAVAPEPTVPVSVMLGAAVQFTLNVPLVVIGFVDDDVTVKSVVSVTVKPTLVTVPEPPVEHEPQVGALPLLYNKH